jgi:hypothetical protein
MDVLSVFYKIQFSTPVNKYLIKNGNIKINDIHNFTFRDIFGRYGNFRTSFDFILSKKLMGLVIELADMFYTLKV